MQKENLIKIYSNYIKERSLSGIQMNMPEVFEFFLYFWEESGKINGRIVEVEP